MIIDPLEFQFLIIENTYSLSIFIKNNGANHRRALIYLRVTVNGRRAEISAKKSVHPDRWDSSTNRMKGNKEDAKAANTLLDIMTIKLNKIYNRLVENDETITAKKIKEIYLGKEIQKKSLVEVFLLHNKMMSQRVGIDFSKSTFQRYTTTYDHIIQFLKQQYNLDDILLNDIKYSFINDLEHFLKVTRKCNHNSSQKYIRNFRKNSWQLDLPSYTAGLFKALMKYSKILAVYLSNAFSYSRI